MARIITTKPAAKITPGSVPRILESRILPENAASFAAEALEPRIVFAVNVGAGLASATGLSNVQVNEIINGLEDIGALGDALEQLGGLATPLASLGASFGDLFNLGTANGTGGFLGDAFRDQLNGLLKDPGLPPTGPTVIPSPPRVAEPGSSAAPCRST